MNYKEREINSLEALAELLGKCDTVRIGINGEKYPYVVPVSFGYEIADNKIVIYIHGAETGLKNELIAKNANVCVEADLMYGYVWKGYKTTADYESIIGFGKAEIPEYEEAVRGVELLAAHCGQPGMDGRTCIKMGHTRVYKIVLQEISGKRRFKPEERLELNKVYE